jgi:hypothetical protein
MRSHRAPQAVGHAKGAGGAGLGQRHHELVPAVSEDPVALAQLALDERRHLAQDPTARQMPKAIVDLLQVVHVKEQDGEGPAVAPIPLQLFLQIGIQVPAVECRGQVVQDRLVLKVRILVQEPGALQAAPEDDLQHSLLHRRCQAVECSPHHRVQTGHRAPLLHHHHQGGLRADPEDLGEKVQPTGPGQHLLHEDGVVGSRLDLLQGRLGRGGDIYPKALSLQQAGELLADLAVLVHDENPPGGHRGRGHPLADPASGPSSPRSLRKHRRSTSLPRHHRHDTNLRPAVAIRRSPASRPLG